MLKHALFVEHLPDTITGKRKTSMGYVVYDTEEAAENERTTLRRQNLPFKSWVISFEDPRAR